MLLDFQLESMRDLDLVPQKNQMLPECCNKSLNYEPGFAAGTMPWLCALVPTLRGLPEPQGSAGT